MAVYDDVHLFAQCNEPLIIMKDRIGTRQLFGGIHRHIVRIDRQPGRSRGEAGIFRRVPLHGRAGIVTAAPAHHADALFLGHKAFGKIGTVVSEGFDVVDLIDACPGIVGHAQLFALKDIGRALHHMQAGRKHLGACFPIFLLLAAVARNDAWLVMVVPVKAVPGDALQVALPAAQDLLESGQILVLFGIASQNRVEIRIHMLELEDHGELAAVQIGIRPGFLQRNPRTFAHGQKVIF